MYAELRGRALIESRFGPLGKGLDAVVINDAEYDLDTLLARMDLKLEDTWPIDIVVVSETSVVCASTMARTSASSPTNSMASSASSTRPAATSPNGWATTTTISGSAPQPSVAARPRRQLLMIRRSVWRLVTAGDSICHYADSRLTDFWPPTMPELHGRALIEARFEPWARALAVTIAGSTGPPRSLSRSASSSTPKSIDALQLPDRFVVRYLDAQDQRVMRKNLTPVQLPRRNPRPPRRMGRRPGLLHRIQRTLARGSRRSAMKRLGAPGIRPLAQQIRLGQGPQVLAGAVHRHSGSSQSAGFRWNCI